MFDPNSSELCLEAGGIKTVLPLLPEYEAPQEAGKDTANEEFTSDSSEDEPFVSWIDDLGQEDGLVLIIGKDIEPDEEIIGEETEIQM